MNILTVTLKQHTPIIHFQHDQEGATLRASEVKPKLDKFILTKLSAETKANGVKEGWIKVKDGKTWLDYKMKIESKQIDSSIQLTIVHDRNNKYYARLNNQSKDEFPFLLCNMGGKTTQEELMNLSLYKENKLYITVVNKDLCELIEDNIAAMFAVSNFGQRTTKGFGSFSVISLEGGKKEWSFPKFNDLVPDKTPMLRFSVSGDNMLNKQLMLFQTLDFYWKCLKSGINYSKRKQDRNNSVKILNPERYIKPYIYTYLNQVRFKTWEKRLIKETFPQLKTKTPNRYIASNNNQPIFARGMLGCPMFFEYKIPQGTFHPNNEGRPVEDKKEYRVNISNSEIERISSPIVFKPTITDDNEVSVYILFDDEVIRAAENETSVSFSFTCERKEGKEYIAIDGNVSIDISPSSIDYLQLIQKYHFFIGTDRQMSDSIFYDTDIKGDNRKFKMIPRNFRWENILGQTDNSENLVSFFQVKHNVQ